MRVTLALAGLAALAATACDETPAVERFPYRFEVRSEGAPVEGAQVSVGASAVGATDATGALEVDLQGQEGRQLPLAVECPDGMREPGALRPVVLQRMRALGDQASLRRVRVEVECPPRTRDVALLVRVRGHEDVPVLVNGLERARTDPSGLAHLALRLEPHAPLEVTLSTEHLPDLLPRNPARSFDVPDHDELFVFDQVLAPPVASGRRRRRHPARRDAGPQVPIRIE